eukprot:13651618-Ditylum_brightwellii.AAC.1
MLSTMQKEHIAMKTWYNSTATELKDKHGTSYPNFWQDVVRWNGWKDVRKAYLHHLSMSEKHAGDSTGAAAARKR